MKDWIKLIGLGVCFLVLAGGVPAGLAYLNRKHRAHFDQLRCTCHFTNVVDTTPVLTNLTFIIKHLGGSGGLSTVTLENPGIPITKYAYTPKHQLPPNCAIQVSGEGRYRWKHGDYTSIFTYESPERAEEFFWAFNHAKTSQWTTVTSQP